MSHSAENKIDELVALARQQPEADDPADFETFLRSYFRDVHGEHLADRPSEALLEIARRHRHLVVRRQPEDVAVDVYTPAHGASARIRAVATAAPDMPFLVDTVTMAVRDAGGAIDWMLHPVLRIRRNEDGTLHSVLGPPGDESYGDEESLIEIQFTAGADFDDADLAGRVRQRLDDLQVVVGDWRAMRQRVQVAIEELDNAGGGIDDAERDEAQAFLRWLAEDHFTFLGYRERRVEPGSDSEEVMTGVSESSLGLLRENRPGIDPDGYVAPAAEIDKYALSPRLIVVTKANARAWIHHAEFMDVIAVKRLDGVGNVIGAHRFLGLFSGEAYASSPRSIPILRRKVRNITARAALRPRSHTAKNLHYVLESFPRDELFQGGEDELYETAMGVVALRESQRLRLFMRRDRYGRFFSCLVYVPRERYSLAVRKRLGESLATMLNGQGRESSAQFMRGSLVRVHYIVATSPGTETELSTETIQSRLLETLRTWRDDFEAVLNELQDADEAVTLAAYAEAFPTGYTERYPAADALADARILEGLTDREAPLLRLAESGDQGLQLKLYGRGPETPLAQVLPMLENFGLHVVSQRPFAVTASGRAPAWIHEFAARPVADGLVPQTDVARRVEAAFDDIWAGRAENDGLNRLVIAAGLDARRVALVRTITRYLQQTQLPFSQAYVENQLAEHPVLVAMQLDLFEARCRPDESDRHYRELECIEAIHEQLDAVASPDADRVLRAMLGVVLATLRTNYYQTVDGRPKPYISLKLSPEHLPELPEPRPMFETFVYAPEVEGVHLRGGKVARGGIRWSDRREDFRTEVLGLMKAQMVKNAVIVPVGAKGGFVVKNLGDAGDRETRQQRGIDAYKIFIRGLLDITDNHHAEAIEPPADVVRHDGDDPYLVVAADKGTAGFSDIANGLSQAYGFWLDDAFASGGSAGYDHKTMGITARGAWESVMRHFREDGRDIQSQPFTVVGIGDMGGDVFGNGMLLSEQIRLVAAFNHRHIFIDPDPDPATGFAERQRLFTADASGWDAYDTGKLSAGGGVYERGAKSVELSEQARAALGLEHARYTPNELIRAIIAAPVDLFWNGGIGTYVKARHESHAEVGDRANDAVRVDGRDMRCHVIGEGGNLGLTQAGRIEFAREGGCVNTDAIDNSGGVDSSDMEVNIKIALGAAEAAGRLQRDDRNTLLASMTDSVAELVLRTNYLQTQLISVLEGDSVARFDEQINFMRMLERDGLLDRSIEALPDDEGIEERVRSGEGLTRPELAVLVSYAKMALFADVLATDLPDEPHLETVLFEGFPPKLSEAYPDAIRAHRLRREMVATLVTNQMVDRMGIALAHRAAAETGVSRAAVVRAFVLASEIFGAEDLWRDIEACDNRLPTEVQYRLLRHVAGLVKHGITWLLSHGGQVDAMDTWLSRYRAPARRLLADLPAYLDGGYRAEYDAARAQLAEVGVDDEMAGRLAAVQSAGGAFDILSLTYDSGEDQATVARLYFRVGDWLQLPWLQSAIQRLEAHDRWQALARASLRDDCYRAHRRIVADVLSHPGTDADARLHHWRQALADDAEFVRQRLADLQAGETPSFAHLAVGVRDLARLGGTAANH